MIIINIITFIVIIIIFYCNYDSS